jgi:hypothetical protein
MSVVSSPKNSSSLEVSRILRRVGTLVSGSGTIISLTGSVWNVAVGLFPKRPIVVSPLVLKVSDPLTWRLWRMRTVLSSGPATRVVSNLLVPMIR